MNSPEAWDFVCSVTGFITIVILWTLALLGVAWVWMKAEEFAERSKRSKALSTPSKGDDDV